MTEQNSVIHKDAKISKTAEIGPYTVIGSKVEIGNDVEIHSLVNISGQTKIGDGTIIFPFASIGNAPQDLKFKGENTKLEIGKNNKIREYVTIHPGTEGGGGLTKIGDNCRLISIKNEALSRDPGQLFAALDKPIDFALKRVPNTICMLNNPLYSNAIFSKLLF